MSDRLLLYIDMLGVSDLVVNHEAMEQIFDRIDSLNVHRDRDFGVIVFSDTILVYADGYWLEHLTQAVMWLSEFAQDLLYRLIGIDRHFRAYLTRGDFEHSKRKNFDAYYGEALVECYRREREIQATGLFIDNHLVPYSDIFKTTPFDEHCHYVHLLTQLRGISWKASEYPLHPILIEEPHLVAHDLTYMKNVFEHANDPTLPEKIRLKYASSWRMISDHHPGLSEVLVTHGFDFSAVCRIDWSDHVDRIGTERGFFG